MSLNLKISDNLDKAQSSLVKGAIAAFAAAAVSRIFVSGASVAETEGGVTNEIYTVGKRKNPRLVYIGSKREHVGFAPAVFMLAAAFGVSKAKKRLKCTKTR